MRTAALVASAALMFAACSRGEEAAKTDSPVAAPAAAPAPLSLSDLTGKWTQETRGETGDSVLVKSEINGSLGAMLLNWQPGRGGMPLPPTPPAPPTAPEPAAPVMGPTDPPTPVGGGRPRPPNEPANPEVPPNPPPPVKPPMPITFPTVTLAPTQRGMMPLAEQTN